MTGTDNTRDAVLRFYGGTIVGIVFAVFFGVLGAVTGFGLWWSSAGLMLMLSLVTGFMVHRRGSVF